MDVAIFGTRDLATLAAIQCEDTCLNVAMYIVDSEYWEHHEHRGAPVYSTDSAIQALQKKPCPVLIPVADNEARIRIADKFRDAWIELTSVINISSHIVCGSNVWIQENNTLQPFVTIQDDVIIWATNHIGHHSTIGRGTFITSGCVVSGHVTIGQRCYLGVGCLIRDGVTICDDVTIGMGAVVTKDITEPGTYFGCPARKI